MIKFFRKTRYNLMEQNKTGKYLKYAIGEIVLVVIGILIALQINSWNENRKDRLEEQAVLLQLKEDFQTNLLQLEQKIEMRNKMISLCNKLISSYGKHIDCINDLIALYKYNEINGIPIPEERNADIQLFNELKSVSATLAEEMRVYKQKLSNLLS